MWCLGSALFANVVASFGTNYMYHLILCWFVLLACISAATLEEKTVTDEAAEARGAQQFTRVPDPAETLSWLNA
jgi:hypothetical protein